MCRILLGLVTGLPLPGGLDPARLVRAVRALLDFMYLARYPVHSTATLKLMDDALARFHDNKDVFVDLGIRTDFNFPKLHALLHYSFSIRLFGTSDNYDTEYSERLHIDFAKDAYRATNRRDEYPQMTTWLTRKEKVISFGKFVQWRLLGGNFAWTPQIQLSAPKLELRMAGRPTKSLRIDDLIVSYHAPAFRSTLAKFLVQHREARQLSLTAVNRLAFSLVLPFERVSVYQKIKFQTRDFLRGDSIIVDVIHANPQHGRVPARFDTALVQVERQAGQSELQGEHPSHKHRYH